MNGSSDKGSVSDSTTTSATATVSETRKIGSTGSPGSPGVLHVIDKSRNHKSKVDRFRGSCWWTRYCPDYSKWATDCGHEFKAGGVDEETAGPLKPIDAGFEFCCFCGRELVQDYFEPSVDDEEGDEVDPDWEEIDDDDSTDTYAGESEVSESEDLDVSDAPRDPPPSPEDLGLENPDAPQPSDKLKWKHVDLSEYVDVVIRMVKKGVGEPPEITEVLADDLKTSTTGPQHPTLDIDDVIKPSTSGPSTSTPPQTQAEPIQEPIEPDVPEKWTVRRESSGFIVGGPYKDVRIPEYSPPQSQPQHVSFEHCSMFPEQQPQPQSPPGNPPGLTLRDYFAAHALSASSICRDLSINRYVVETAWSIADMMLAQRERESDYQKWLQMVSGNANMETLEGPWESMFVWCDSKHETATETVGDIWEKYSWDWKEQVKGEHQRILDEM